MVKLVTTIKPSIGYILKDKINLTFAAIPLTIGTVLYVLLGKWMYGSVLESGREMIKNKISSGGWGDFVYWIITAIFTVILFFIINYTFVLVVSVIASPFNDLISSRIEKLEKGEQTDTMGQSFSKMFAKIFKTVFNEAKKITVILFFTVLALLLSFFPFLVPLSLLISSILIAVQFVDYSWARHNLPAGKCFSDVRRNFFSYSLSGGMFLFLISVPIVNLVIPPIATAYFTLLYIRKN